MSKKIKYIVSISLVVLIMTLGIITLIMGIVPVGGNDAINLPDQVYIYSNWYGTENGKLRLRRGEGEENKAETERINQIFNLLNDGFKQKALSALFRGELGKGLEYNKDGAGSINKYKDDENNITIMFVYSSSNEQLADKNDITSNYRYLCFTVNNSTEWKDITFGLGVDYNTEDDESSKPEYYYSRNFSGKMDTSELYKYVYSLIEGAKE